jgi:protein-tyrosine phosphatase
MGNICRSPTAEGVFRHFVVENNLQEAIFIDSAGTHSYHIGSPPDRRSQEAAKVRGYDLSRLQARRVSVDDFEQFDYVVAMDRVNYEDLRQICPDEYYDKVGLFLEYAEDIEEHEVPDPYYGAKKGFEYVLDLVESGAQGLLKTIREKHGL